MKPQTSVGTGLQSLMLGITLSALATGVVLIASQEHIRDYALSRTRNLVHRHSLSKASATVRTPSVKQTKEQIPALFKALDSFKKKGYAVLYDGHEYNVTLAFAKAKQFINDNYKNEALEPWIKTHLYRSKARGEIIYLKYPSGRLRPLRDAIVEVLQTL